MSVLPILKYTDKRTRELAKNVSRAVLVSPEIQKFIDDLTDTMIAANGIGIASTQVGRSLQIFILAGKDRNDAKAFINPKIVSSSERHTYMEEGCLSVPGVYGLVKRSAKVRLKAWDRNGTPVDVKASGLTAKIFQHEVDHLYGILYIDKTERITQGSIDNTGGSSGSHVGL